MLSILLKPAAICIFHCKNIKTHNYISILTKAVARSAGLVFLVGWTLHGPTRDDDTRTNMQLNYQYLIMNFWSWWWKWSNLSYDDCDLFLCCHRIVWRSVARACRRLSTTTWYVCCFSHLFLLRWVTAGWIRWEHLTVSSYREMLMCLPSCVALF